MKRRSFLSHVVPALVLAALLSVPFLAATGCAGAGQYVRDRIEQEGKERARKNTDQAVEKGADAIEGGLKNAARCAVGDDDCIREAHEKGKTVVLTDEDGNVKRNENGDPVTASGNGTRDEGAGGVGAANANYDFKPGERTIFAEDFESDNVGDFPRRLEFKSGNMQVVALQDRRVLSLKRGSKFTVPLPETLPQRFTISFDYFVDHLDTDLSFWIEDPADGKTPYHYFLVARKGGITVHDDDMPSSIMGFGDVLSTDHFAPIRIMVDGRYAKMYVGTNRVANIPNATFPRGDALKFSLYATYGGSKIYLDDLRIAAGGRDLYSALESEGRVAVQDIHFDTGQATIKPESAEAMNKIATLLNEHPDLRLLVQGHTDDQGGFESNMTLSKERAAAVREALVQRHGIDGGRLRAMGLGQTQPAASNDTEAGRAENRRVELVKM